MKTVALIVVTIVLLALIISATTESYAIRVAEQAYFEGQKDALNGDVRVDLKRCGFVRSPWDDGDAPTYAPTLIECQP